MSPFSPRPWLFSSLRLIKPLNYHPPLVTRCLYDGATSFPSTKLTTFQPPSRSFITIPRRSSRTVEKSRSRISSGVSSVHLCSFNCATDQSTDPVSSTQPFSLGAAAVFLSVCVGGILYFRYEKARLERQRVAEAAKGVGRPKVGGHFELVNHEGKEFSDEDMKGGFTLVSVSKWCLFGVTVENTAVERSGVNGMVVDGTLGGHLAEKCFDRLLDYASAKPSVSSRFTLASHTVPTSAQKNSIRCPV